MVTLHISHRTLPAYRHSFFVTQEAWITTRIPLYYLDLAVPSEVLFEKHFEKVFPKQKVEIGRLSTRNDVWKKQRFHLDDISVGCEGRKDSNLFYLYAMSTERKVDNVGYVLFGVFFNKFIAGNVMPPLTSGEKAERFLNLATLVGYQQWREITLDYLPSDRNLLVDSIFQRIYPSVIKGIYEKKSEHPLLLKKFWDLFCITDNTRFTSSANVPDAEHLKFVLEVANRTQFDFWGFRYGKCVFAECTITRYIKEKKFDLITMLLDYGFSLGEMLLVDTERCLCHKPLSNLFLKYASQEFVHNRVMVLFLVKCYETCGNNLLDAPGFIELYQKLSRSLPLPSLPPSMVREHLRKALEPSSSTAVVEEMVAIYEAVQVHPYADCDVVAPQKLSQLSRCVLRRALSANYKLPNGDSGIGLPTLLKRFLNLEF